MEIKTIAQTTQRHANNFSSGSIVFEASHADKTATVTVCDWNKNNKSFVVSMADKSASETKISSSSNYPKAIGLAVLLLTA